jgi:hypothetical protein
MEIRRKPLPAPPSQFRLGEGGQPWSTWSLPDGYDPDTHPKDDDDDDDDYETIPAASPVGDSNNRNSATYATNPTMVSTFSPDPAPSSSLTTSPPPARARDLETGRAKELGALSAAMMTVDNGFESQWWYQGRRETVATTTTTAPASDEHHSPPPQTPDESPIHRWSSNRHPHPHPMSAVSGTVTSLFPPETPVLPAGVVSPMTEAAFSPVPAPAGLLLTRSMSTRSEELWFREGGR